MFVLCVLLLRNSVELKNNENVYKFIIKYNVKGGSRHKNLCMTRVLGFLIR